MELSRSYTRLVTTLLFIQYMWGACRETVNMITQTLQPSTHIVKQEGQKCGSHSYSLGTYVQTHTFNSSCFLLSGYMYCKDLGLHVCSTFFTQPRSRTCTEYSTHVKPITSLCLLAAQLDEEQRSWIKNTAKKL